MKRNTRSYRVRTIGYLIGSYILPIFVFYNNAYPNRLNYYYVGLQTCHWQMAFHNILNGCYNSLFFIKTSYVVTEYCNICSFALKCVQCKHRIEIYFHPFHWKCKHWMITSSFQMFLKMCNLFRIQSDVVLRIFLKL